MHKEIFEQNNKIVKGMILRERKQYFNSKISNCKTSKALFCVANEMKGSSTVSLPSGIETSNLPDTFGQFFSDKISKIRSGLDKFMYI